MRQSPLALFQVQWDRFKSPPTHYFYQCRLPRTVRFRSLGLSISSAQAGGGFDNGHIENLENKFSNLEAYKQLNIYMLQFNVMTQVENVKACVAIVKRLFIREQDDVHDSKHT